MFLILSVKDQACWSKLTANNLTFVYRFHSQNHYFALVTPLCGWYLLICALGIERQDISRVLPEDASGTHRLLEEQG